MGKMSEFLERYQTLRKLRSVKSAPPPKDQEERRAQLTEQSTLANAFMAYIDRLGHAFSEVRAAHLEFSNTLHDIGLRETNPWTELPLASMDSFKQVIDRMGEELAHISKAPLEDIQRQYEICHMQIVKQDELAWELERYDKKLAGLRAASPTERGSLKIARNEEKIRTVSSEYDNVRRSVEKQLQELTTKIREEESIRISTMMDEHFEVFEKFGREMSQPRRQIISKKQKSGPKGLAGFLTREINKSKETRNARASLKQQQRTPKGRNSQNPFDEDMRNDLNVSTNPFDNDIAPERADMIAGG